MDSFMHKHQSALDSFMEDKAIQELEDAGIYPDSNIQESLPYEKEAEDFYNSEDYEPTDEEEEIEDKDFPYEEENYD